MQEAADRHRLELGILREGSFGECTIERHRDDRRVVGLPSVGLELAHEASLEGGAHGTQERPVQLRGDADEAASIGDHTGLLERVGLDVPGPVGLDEPVERGCVDAFDRRRVSNGDGVQRLGDEGYVLSDATAYNMQFVDGMPIHIDVLSVQPYEEGQPWSGYNQFCRQFLLPLLIEAWAGVSYQAMYRGSIDGIAFEDALAILPKRKLFTSLTGFSHVYLHGKSVTAASSENFEGTVRKTAQVSKNNYLAILRQIQGFLQDLKKKHRGGSYWNSYAVKNSYSDQMRETKLSFVRAWAECEKPGLIWDVGGNTGDFSRAALDGGAQRSVVLDSDTDSLEYLYNTHTKSGAAILPLKMNLSDPSTDIGWSQAERKGLMTRANADGMLALAVIHHLVIGSNLPLNEVVDWFLDIAPTGVIEFVPKEDPMVRQLLDHRSDVFSDYTEEHFRELVMRRKTIVREHKFDSNGRLLISYRDK